MTPTIKLSFYTDDEDGDDDADDADDEVVGGK